MSRVYTIEGALERLRDLDGWTLEEGQLVRSFHLGTFLQALVFVNKVGELAEQEQHHPDIDIRYNSVRLALSSHDVSGITDRDFRLAERINSLL